MFSLHPGSGIPIYRQLVDQVRRLIAGGQLPPGAELPSVRDLAVQYAVNPMTISKAYSLLEARRAAGAQSRQAHDRGGGPARAGQPHTTTEADRTAGAATGAVCPAAGADAQGPCGADRTQLGA